MKRRYILSLFLCLLVIISGSVILSNEELKPVLQTAWFQMKGVSTKAQQHFDDGDALYHSGHFLEAIESYTQCINIEPGYASAYHSRGLAKHALKMYDVAIDDYTEAIKRGYNNANVYYNRGTARLFTGYYDWALNDFNKAIEIDPNHALSYYNRGVIYKSQADSDSKLGRTGQRKLLWAINDFNQATRSNPKFASAYMRLGEIKHDLGLTTQAKHDFIKALSVAEEIGNWKIEKEARQVLKSQYSSFTR